MRVLITNITLASRSGTEINVRDIAIGLLRRGHRPVVYSPELGAIAEEIRAATVPVVDRIAAVGAPPDVIHGHHNAPLMTALLHFPAAPALFFCHDWDSWFDEPPRFPRLLRYVAVDGTVRDRLTNEHGLAPERIATVWNAVDLERFAPRAALPPRPRRAAIFSGRPSGRRYVESVREAAASAGIELDLIGPDAGAAVAAPEAALAGCDLVFARARCALEAMATGCAVILAGESGLGGMVTSSTFDRQRESNFGRRELWRTWSAAAVAAEIERYDPADAACVARRVREEAGLEGQLDQLERLYGELVEAQRARPAAPEADLAAAAAFLERWGPRLGGDFYRAKSEQLQHNELPLGDRLYAAEREAATLREERDRLAEALRELGDGGGRGEGAKPEEPAAIARLLQRFSPERRR